VIRHTAALKKGRHSITQKKRQLLLRKRETRYSIFKTWASTVWKKKRADVNFSGGGKEESNAFHREDVHPPPSDVHEKRSNCRHEERKRKGDGKYQSGEKEALAD